MVENLVVKSKVKEAVEDLNVSADFVEKLNEEVLSLVKKACVRAKDNGRKTVQAKDL